MEREPASHWYRGQIRQAVRYGGVWTAIAFAALLWPLVFSLLTGSLVATLAAYAVAFISDCVLFLIWLRRSVGYSKRARRGETFSVGRNAA